MASLLDTIYQTEFDKLAPHDETNAISHMSSALSKTVLKFLEGQFSVLTKIPFFIISGTKGPAPVSGIPGFLSVNITDSTAAILDIELYKTLLIYSKLNQTLLYTKIFQTIGLWLNTNIFLSVTAIASDSTGLNQYLGFTILNFPGFNSIPGIFADLKDKSYSNFILTANSLTAEFDNADDPDSLPQIKISILTDAILQGMSGNIVTPIPITLGTGVAQAIDAGTAIPVSPTILFLDTPNAETKLPALNLPTSFNLSNLEIPGLSIPGMNLPGIPELLRPKFSIDIVPLVNSKKVDLQTSVDQLKREFSGIDQSALDEQIKQLQTNFNSAINIVSVSYTGITFAKIIKMILTILFPLLLIFLLGKFLNGILLGSPSEYIKLIDGTEMDTSNLVPSVSEVQAMYPTDTSVLEDNILNYYKNNFNITDEESQILKTYFELSKLTNKSDLTNFSIDIQYQNSKLQTKTRIQAQVLSITSNKIEQKHIAYASKVF